MRALGDAQKPPGLGLPQGVDWLLQVPEVMEAFHADQKALSHVYMHYAQVAANTVGPDAFVAGGRVGATARNAVRFAASRAGDEVLAAAGDRSSGGVAPLRWPALKLFCMEFRVVGKLATMDQVRRIALSVAVTDVVARAGAAGRPVSAKAVRRGLELEGALQLSFSQFLELLGRLAVLSFGSRAEHAAAEGPKSASVLATKTQSGAVVHLVRYLEASGGVAKIRDRARSSTLIKFSAR